MNKLRYVNGREKLHLYLILIFLGGTLGIGGAILGNWTNMLDLEKDAIAVAGIGIGMLLLVIIGMFFDEYLSGKEAE